MFMEQIQLFRGLLKFSFSNTTKSMQTIERLKNDITAAEEDLQSKRQIRTEIESDALKLEGCYTDLDEDIEEKDKYFNSKNGRYLICEILILIIIFNLRRGKGNC